MPEEAGKHLCSGPGHGIDEMRINRHPKTHICRPNLHALQTHLLLLSQTTLCCCTSFSRKCGSFLPPPGSHLQVFGAHSEVTFFRSPATSSTFTHRAEPGPRTTSPRAALADVVSAHLGISRLLHIRLICSNGTEILKFPTCKKTAQDFHTHMEVVISLLRKSCSKLASWSAGTQSKECSLSTDILNTEFNAVWFYKTLMLCPQTGILAYCCLRFQSASRKMRELSFVCCM